MYLLKRLQAAIKSFKNPDLIQEIPFVKLQPTIITTEQLLADKNVLITGAGKNIGKAIAEAMANHGANIYFTDINPDYINKLNIQLQQNNIKCKGFLADINSYSDTDKICNFFLKNKINIDILINNVGIQFDDNIGIQNTSQEKMFQTFHTNVFSPMYMTQKIVNQMIENKTPGSIIFITSIHQFTAMRIPSYSASKAALGAIVEELAVDLSGYNIRVNSIAPGWVAEDVNGNSLEHSCTPLHKSSINPNYIGKAAVYLSSDYFSRFTTGTMLKIDAGLSLYNYRIQQHPPNKHSNSQFTERYFSDARQ
jgi:NAD(P)-dependent dehydrogenase (short-subunit alcohol dehydrogenase family)